MNRRKKYKFFYQCPIFERISFFPQTLGNLVLFDPLEFIHYSALKKQNRFLAICEARWNIVP